MYVGGTETTPLKQVLHRAGLRDMRHWRNSCTVNSDDSFSIQYDNHQRRGKDIDRLIRLLCL
jgi:hypothetical protein